MKLEGIHHITCITADAPRNVDFYARILGLRMVKKTVNQDDPSVYHLFYADEEGSPGADLTFFEFPGVPAGRAGDGMVHRITWRVASTDALDFWATRLDDEGYESSATGDRLRFRDFEGLELELAVVDSPDPPLIAEHPEIPRDLALQGFDAVRAYASDPERSRPLLEEALAFEPAGDGWEARGERRGSRYAYDPPPPERGPAGRRHGAPRRLGVARRRARGLARARDRRGRTSDACDRPLLVPLHLLPRAQRSAVRAGHLQPRIRGRRGSRSTWARASCCRRSSSRGARRSRLASRRSRTRAWRAARPAQRTGERRRGGAGGVRPRACGAGGAHYRAFVGPPAQYDLIAGLQFSSCFRPACGRRTSSWTSAAGRCAAAACSSRTCGPGHYYGVEPNEWLVQEGLERELGADFVRVKRPTFSTISDFGWRRSASGSTSSWLRASSPTPSVT